jgi:hypothetical protein
VEYATVVLYLEGEKYLQRKKKKFNYNIFIAVRVEKKKDSLKIVYKEMN